MGEIAEGVQAAWGGIGRQLDPELVEEGELLVHREGYSRARHTFSLNGSQIGRLKWRGPRRAEYEGGGSRYDIYVASLENSIRLVSESGRETRLIERSRANSRQERLRIEFPEGATFCLLEPRQSRGRLARSFMARKAFQTADLMVCNYDIGRRTQTTLRVRVNADMKRESRFFHRLVALIACWVILERRRLGGQPLKKKEDRASVHPPKRDGRKSPRV